MRSFSFTFAFSLALLTTVGLSLSPKAAAAETYTTNFAPDPQFTVGTCLTRFDYNNISETMALLKKAGIHSIRIDVSWKEVETSPGVYAMQKKWDDMVNAATNNDIQVIVILAYGNPIYSIVKPKTAAEIDKFKTYALRVVDHFRSRVKYFEIWNEWDGETGGAPAGTPADYINLVSAVYPALKLKAPYSTFMVGTTYTPALRNGYFDELLSRGLTQYGDAIAVHPYVFFDPAPTNQPENFFSFLYGLRTKIQSKKPGMPVYVTELGWPTHLGKNASSLSQQADFFSRTILLSRWMGQFAGVWFFNFRDNQQDGIGQSPFDHQQNFGMMTNSGLLKPAFEALADSVGTVQNATRQDRFNVGNSDIYAFSYTQQNGPKKYAVWAIKDLSENNPHQLKVSCAAGETIKITRAGYGASAQQACNSTISVGQTPLLIEGDAVSFQLIQ